jgi:hypothetical protein
MPRPPKRGIDPLLAKAITGLLREVMAKDSKASINDKMRVIDRALKMEAIKHKMSEEGYGSGFFDDDDRENEGDNEIEQGG